VKDVLQIRNFVHEVQYLERFLDIIGQQRSVSKSNQLHVNIFQIFFANSSYILLIPLNKFTIWGK
jgi:hypothetical protein